jgi:NAD(P)-dependent dehydrogenase (short-subunit alcohol dehydrogenase family)
MYPEIDLSTAVVVITGGARGIGQATALAFANLGATVYAGDLPEPSPPPPLPEPTAFPDHPGHPAVPGQPAFPNQPGATAIRARPLDVTSRDSFATLSTA